MAKLPVFEGILLDESITYTLYELTQMGNISEAVIIEMHEHGIIEPQGETQDKWIFTSRSVIRFKKAMRLHHDLDINWAGISLVLDLIEQRDELHHRLMHIKDETN